MEIKEEDKIDYKIREELKPVADSVISLRRDIGIIQEQLKDKGIDVTFDECMDLLLYFHINDIHAMLYNQSKS